jgi:ion channel-forming bestrophin family protein
MKATSLAVSIATRRWMLVVFLLMTIVARLQAFSISSRTPTGVRTRSPLQLSTTNEEPTTFGERSRPFRRDVFGYDNWVQHRSPDRFIGNLLDILKSGVFRELLPSCLWTSSVATFILLYNCLLVQGYDDFSGVHHDALLAGTFLSLPLMKMPMDFFNLCTPSLALLLGTLFVRNE